MLSTTDSSVLVVSKPQNAIQSLTNRPAPMTSLPRLTVPAWEDSERTSNQQDGGEGREKQHATWKQPIAVSHMQDLCKQRSLARMFYNTQETNLQQAEPAKVMRVHQDFRLMFEDEPAETEHAEKQSSKSDHFISHQHSSLEVK